MSNRTPIYNFLYLEDGDIIYSGYDSDNMNTAENQFFGAYSYMGQGIIDGWTIHWMGCSSDPYVQSQKQALIDAYRDDPFSYLAVQYQSLAYPETNEDWAQCVVVKPGLGIVDVFHAAVENPSFFRFDSINHYYVWAQKNACTNTEYLCEIIAPLYPDEDYDLTTNAVYIGEVFTGLVGGNVSVTQILYSERRRELKNGQGEIQRLMKQALINHVHSGEGDMPPKINLDNGVYINVSIEKKSNVFVFNLPNDFTDGDYAPANVYLNGVLLSESQYSIELSGQQGTIFLQNIIDLGASLQIVYLLAPGKNIYITSSLNPPLQSRTLSFSNVYYLTDGSTTTETRGEVGNESNIATFNVWSWSDADYTQINVYLKGVLMDDSSYILYQVNGVENAGGRLQFVGPILPSILEYNELDVEIRFIKPKVEVVGRLNANRIKSIDASSFKRGSMPLSRLSQLSHYGVLRYDEPVFFVPDKILLDSGDHIRFYPSINSPIQFSDTIIFSTVSANIQYADEFGARTIMSTPNGLFATLNSVLDHENVVKLSWNTDGGSADKFSDNYFGVFNVYNTGTQSASELNPRTFWSLSLSKNQFQNKLSLSQDYGQSFNKISLPFTSTGELVVINDFIYSVDVFVNKNQIELNSIYYLACEDGLYTAVVARTENKLMPAWNNPQKNTSNFATGAINAISEAVNVGTITTTSVFGAETAYTNIRSLYAACDNGLFVFQNNYGVLFATLSANYNTDGSEFNFVNWLGSTESNNIPYGLVWGDFSGAYYSYSGQQTSVYAESSDGSSTEIDFAQPLTVSRNTTINVQCASTENINLRAMISSIDDYSFADGDVVLLKNQTNASENGYYVWASASQSLYKQNFGLAKVFVQNGSQAETEWIEVDPPADEPNKRNFVLWFARILQLSGGDYITSAVLDKSSGFERESNSGSGQSFFVSTTKYIYRVIVNSASSFPIVTQINWDFENNGLISSIQHYGIADPENGTLVVFTNNGVFKSTASSFTYGPLDAFGDLILPNNTYERFINVFDASGAANSSVYDAYSLNEINGKIVSIGFSTNIVTGISDGVYTNQRVLANNTSGSGLTVDFQINSGIVSNLAINNPGSGYESDIPLLSVFVANQGVVSLQNAVSEGVFTANSDSQYFIYSKNDGINPSRLLYSTEYRDFYAAPWSGDSLVMMKINGELTNQSFAYDASKGLIRFENSQPKPFIDSISISLINAGQYISMVGQTPHEEIFNTLVVDSVPSAKIKTTYDPLSASTNILELYDVDNTKWNNNVRAIKVTGTRSIDGVTTQPYSEAIQVVVDTTAGVTIYVKSKPTVYPLTADSNVFTANVQNNILGIEDRINLHRTGLTYHLDSVSHANVYNLSNSVLKIKPNLYSFNNSGVVSGANRGLKNNISIGDISGFDPSATFIGYVFGVSPSSEDVAANPAFINRIISFEYGANPIFATNKGIWTYDRTNQSWIRTDTLDNSSYIYFANKEFNQVQYAGTNQGLYYLYDGAYVQNSLFNEAVLCMDKGAWESNSSYEAYGLSDTLSFNLTTKDSQTGATIFRSDYVNGLKINDVFSYTFNRYDDEGRQTVHPALLAATNLGVWAFTTSPAPGAPVPQDRGEDHTLLVGREMFGSDIIRNKNLINPDLPGVPAQIYQIKNIPSAGRSTWLAVASSNGVYLVINWRQCDVGKPNGLTFYPQNINARNKTIGRQCYKIINKTNDASGATYFVATDIGVFKSTDRCNTWETTSAFEGKQLTVSDISYVVVDASSGYLIASTNQGLWSSNDDGDSWVSIKEEDDTNIQIPTDPVYGFSLQAVPEQSFESITTGIVSKAFAYLNTKNLQGLTTVSAYISNGNISTSSTNSVILSPNSYSGMYGFEFNNTACLAGTAYSLGINTDGSSYASQVVWSLSSLNDPYQNGSASTSVSEIENKDFYFRINLNTPPDPIEIIEPVGFYDSNYPVGFGQGEWSGAVISSDGRLYSKVGLVVNVLLDVSKSMELNDDGVITINGVSTGYIRQAVINSVVPNGINTLCLYSRLLNGMGTSKMLASVYGFSKDANDLLFFASTGVGNSSACLQSGSIIEQGYVNNPSLIQSSIDYVTNNGRLSRFYDALQYMSRLQYPNVINDFYSLNLSQLDQDDINIQLTKEEYKGVYTNFISLDMQSTTPNTYTLKYNNNDTNFVWVGDNFTYSMAVYEDGSGAITPNNDFSFDSATGICTDTSGGTPVLFYLSKDWGFDASIADLSSSYDDWSQSPAAVDLVLNQYAKSFKPLIIATTDGNDNSQTSISQINESLKTSWGKNGTQVLAIESSSSGNENFIRESMVDTNSFVFKYTNYPETELQNILVTDDTLGLYSSVWERNYDFESPRFIKYIYTSYTALGSSSAVVEFKWSKDRVNFSEFISLESGSKYFLNQKVLAVKYRVLLTEDYQNGTRVSPYIEQLYHVEVSPALQTYLSYEQPISGQLFETLAQGSFLNNALVSITPVVGRTQSTDIEYYDIVQLNRQGTLPNRQSSYRITPPYSVEGLKILPLTSDPLNLGYYVVDAEGRLYTWSQSDVFSLFVDGTQVAPSPPANAYSTIPESGIVYINAFINSEINGEFLYESYSVNIEYVEKRESIIGEPTITSDYVTYYFKNGRIPTDAKVVVLVNQEIYKGEYTVSPYDGFIVFANALQESDYVTAYIQFADSYRAGIQIESYSADLTLQNFNFTHTSIPNLDIYNESFASTEPLLIGFPIVLPETVNIDSAISVSYQYFDDQSAPENGSDIQWWRKRTGIEYATFDPSASLNIVPGFSGIATFDVSSLYNNESPFILELTAVSDGITTNISSVYIKDRGQNFIGTSTEFPSSSLVVVNNSSAVLTNVGMAVTVSVLNVSYIPGFANTDGFIKISSENPIGYVTSIYGVSGSVIFENLPEYSSRLTEKQEDVGSRLLFDGGDLVYVTVSPNNGKQFGPIYQSNTKQITPYYTPVVSNLIILNSTIVYNGFTTSLFINSKNDQKPGYIFNYALEPYVQSSSINWFKETPTGPKHLSNQPSLSSSLISVNDQIYYSVYPGVINFDGVLGFGNTVFSDVYTTQ